MLTIRLRRQGAKKNAKYRIVVAESARAREGSFIEVIGHYNPRTTPEQLVVDRERLAHWLGEGAQASNTVRTLVSRHKGDTVTEPAVVRRVRRQPDRSGDAERQPDRGSEAEQTAS